MKKFNNPILSIIEDKLPPRAKLVQYLMNTLEISKESAYRRMREQIPFSFDEVAKLCKDLHFSVDQIISESDSDGSVFFKMEKEEPFGENVIYKFLSKLADDLDDIVKDKNSDARIVLNYLPLWALQTNPLRELHYCRQLYAQEKISVMQTFKDIVVPNKINEKYNKIATLWEQLPNVCVVLDNSTFQKVVDEIKYFYAIKFFAKEDVEYMYKGMIELFEYYTILAITGKNHFGNSYKIYLSNLPIDANVAYYKANNSEISEIWLYPEQRIQIYNNEIINSLHKNWIQTQIKSSSLITSSNDILQREFFQKTYNSINSLLNL